MAWRIQPPAGRSAEAVEIERLRRENEKLTAELTRTKAALEVVGKAHALLELLSGSANAMDLSALSVHHGFPGGA